MKLVKLLSFLCFGILLLFSDTVTAQTTITIGTGSSSSSTRGPFQRADTNSTTVFSRWVQVFTASELAAAGITSGDAISELKWELASSNVIVGSGDASLKIYVKNSSATAAMSDTWTNHIAGSSLVYDQNFNTTNNFPGANGWMGFTFSTPFIYTGGALEVAVDWDCSQVTTPAFSGNGAIKWRWSSTAPDNLVVKKTASSSPSSNITDLKDERANIQIVYTTPPPTTVDLTFSVDLSQYTGTFTTAYINGSFNGWNGTTNSLTDMGNGIWSGTITVPANDSLEYKFTLDGWTAQENFVGGEPCTKTSGGFTNRFLAYGNTNMTVPTVCWNSCVACPVNPPPTANITFMVNTANITVDPTGIYLAGGTNFGVPGDNPMTDADGDGIWEITVNKPQGNLGNFIFLNGNCPGWNCKEDLTGLSCADPNNFNDRTMPMINGDTTLLFCFGTCSADTTCPAPPTTVDLTFSVDLSQYTGTFTTAYINGSFNGWNGSTNPLMDQGNGIWSGTITVPANDSLEYKFTLDGWTVAEQFGGGEPCTKTTGANVNRFLAYGNTDMTVPTVCWNSCAACVVAPSTVDLTFSVDLSQYTGTFTTAYINGSFNGWNGTTNSLTDMGNGIWSGTITVPANDSLEYKFTLDGWTAQENFVGGEPCTKTAGGFTNRFLAYGNMNMTVPTVCWNSCVACPVNPPPTANITFMVNTANITVDPTGIYLAGGANFGVPGDNPMTDTDGDGVWEITVNKPQGNLGNFIFLNGNSGWGAKENLAGLPCADPNNFDDRTMPTITGDTTLLFCFGTCSADTTCPAPPTTVDLTFSVDMSQYTGTFTTAYINGSFNGWNGTANPLNDMGNGIWSGTITVPMNDSLEYKFTLDGWTVQENFIGGEPCTKTGGGFTNRFLAYGNMDMTVPTVCWNSCAACPPMPVSYCNTQVYHFGNTTDAASSVFLTIENTGAQTMKVTIESANTDPVDDLIVNNSTGPITGSPAISAIDNSVPGKLSRTLTWTGTAPTTIDLNVLWSKVSAPGNWQLITSPGNTTVDFNNTCTTTPTTVDLTFSVDLSQYTGTFTTAYINGSFNGWNGTTNSLTDMGNGIWSGTITVPANDSLEYKFTLDGWTAQENFVGGEPCTKTSGGFTNRFLAYGNMNMTIPTVCWNSCVACPVNPPPTANITFMVNTANITVDPTGIYLAGGTNFGVPGDNPMTDTDGDGVWEITVNKPQGNLGNFIFLNGNSGWGAKENLAGLPCADPNNFDDRTMPTITGDTTLLFCFGTCSADTTCPAPPTTVDLTFSVDMSQYTGTFTTAYINGSFNGWNGTANPLTDQGNGIWSGTITVPENDSLEYKFTLDGWTVQENFTGGEPCTKTGGGFTNRFLAYGNMNMTVPTVCWNSCTSCPIAPPTTVDLTFTVDMSQHGAAFTTAYISGDFNGWSGTANPLTDQGNGMWTGTITVPENDSIEYKFQLDDWAIQEGFSGGEPCVKSSGGFHNRFLAYGNMNMTVDTVCWNSCVACPVAPPDSVDVTFLVATSNITVDPTGLFLAGGGTFGVPGDNPMSDADGDGVWEITVTLPEGFASDYTFTNGNSGWGAKENITGQPCAVPPFDDRHFSGAYSDTILLTCFGSCVADTICPAPTPTVDLTFTVDMSQYTASFTTVYISGNFNGWGATDNPLTDQGNGLWSGTITVPENDSIEYKFQVDAWAAQESFSGGEPCVKSSGGFHNRFLTYGNMNMTVPTVCWNSCTTCPIAPPTTVDLTFTVDMSQYGAAFTTAYISGDFNGWSGTANALTDQGNGMWTGTITVPENDSIEYKFTLDDWAVQENFTGSEPCTKTSGGFTNRFLMYGNMNMTADTVCWNSCSACPLAPPDSVDVTFLVATSNITVDPTGLFLAGGGTFGVPGDNPMSDADGDGVWEITVTLPEGFASDYTFTNGNSGWGAKENITGQPCAVPPFNDRNFPGAYSDTTLLTCFGSCVADTICPAPPAMVDLTFGVDMSQYTASFTTVYISGSFNNWAGTANPLTDQGNGVWSGTISVPVSDSIEYKFQVDDWAVQESFVGGEPCTKTSGTFVNRFLAYGNMNMTVPTVCWNSCTACPVAPPDSVSVTFRVDLSTQDSIASDGVFLAGTFNGWGDTPMMDMNGDSTFELTLMLAENMAYEFKFKNGAAGWEQLDTTYGTSCFTPGGFGNRNLMVGVNDTTLTNYCFETCATCAIVPTKQIPLTANFSMMPNPANNYVQLVFDNEFVATEKNIFVHNAVGQVVYNRIINNVNTHSIETTNLPQGMYYITVQTKEGIQTKRLVVSH